MTNLRHSVTAHVVAGITAAALVLQALLISMTTPQARTAAAVERLAVHALCLGTATQAEDANLPSVPLPQHANHDCCILCTAPGLAPGEGGTVTTPVWRAPLAAPLIAGKPRPPITRAERAPIKARAPPA